MGLVLFLASAEGRLEGMSPGWQDLTGLAPGVEWSEAVPSNERPGIKSAWRTGVGGGKGFELRWHLARARSEWVGAAALLERGVAVAWTPAGSPPGDADSHRLRDALRDREVELQLAYERATLADRRKEELLAL